MKRVVVYTDGACRGNPGPGGWAALIVSDSGESRGEKELSGGEANTTNNRMEMISAINALKELREPCEVELYSDSRYLINGMTDWIKGWIKNNWVNSTKQPVKNKELWLELLEASKPHKISWSWVAGHSGHEFNERVDKLAKSRCAKNRSAGRE